MDPTPEGAGAGETGAPAPSELVPTTGRRHPARAGLAALAVIALVGVVVGVVAVAGPDGGHGSHDALVLVPGGPAPEKAAAASGILQPASAPYRYHLTIAAPDLGSTARVGRLDLPAVDDARIASIGAVFDMHGAVRELTGGQGRELADGSGALDVTPTPGGWQIAYTRHAIGYGSAGSISGTTGSGISGGGSGGSVGSGTTVASSTTTTAPPAPPSALPDDTTAERIARSVLDRMGVDGDWSATVTSAEAGNPVACAPNPCALIGRLPVPQTREVTLQARFAGVPVDGLTWRIDIGDRGRVEVVWGMLTRVRTLGRYALRGVGVVFADLAAGRGIDPNPTPVMGVPTPAVPFQATAPVDVAIDHVTLGYAVMPASDHGTAVVDIVPTYIFSGRTSAGVQVSRTLVAVVASVGAPATKTLPTKPLPGGRPVGKPEPAPLPAPAP